jgi:hypothetical protein
MQARAMTMAVLLTSAVLAGGCSGDDGTAADDGPGATADVRQPSGEGGDEAEAEDGDGEAADDDTEAPAVVDPEGVSWRAVDVVPGLRFAVPEPFEEADAFTASAEGIRLDAGTNVHAHAVVLDQAAYLDDTGEPAAHPDLDAVRAELEGNPELAELSWETTTHGDLLAARFRADSLADETVREGVALQAPGGVVVLERRLYAGDADDELAGIPFDAYVERLEIDPDTVPGGFWLGG